MPELEFVSAGRDRPRQRSGNGKFAVGFAATALMAVCGLVLSVERRVPLVEGGAPWALCDYDGQVNIADKVVVAGGNGRWQLSSNLEVEFQSRLYHGPNSDHRATFVWDADDALLAKTCHVPISSDLFGNFQSWCAAWERGRPVMWVATGYRRQRTKGTSDKDHRISIGKLHRIDFRKPTCIVQSTYDGWSRINSPSAEIMERLNACFIIPDTGRETCRSYRTAVPGTNQSHIDTNQILVSLGRNGGILVDSTLGVADYEKPALRELPRAVRQRAVDLRKSTSRGPITNVHVNVSAPPERLSKQAIEAIAACRSSGLFVPEIPGTPQAQRKVSALPRPAQIQILSDNARPPVGNLIARLPTGQSIELAGISAGSHDKQTAWTADGSQIADVSRDWKYGITHNETPIYGNNSDERQSLRARHLLVRLSGFSANTSVRCDLPGTIGDGILASRFSGLPLQYLPRGMRPESMLAGGNGRAFLKLTANVASESDGSAEVDVGQAEFRFSSAPWGKWMQIAVETGEIINPPTLADLYSSLYKRFAVETIGYPYSGWWPNEPSLLLKVDKGTFRTSAYEIRAIDSDGKFHSVRTTNLHPDNPYELATGTWPLSVRAPDETKLVRYELRLRPYCSVVKFSGIAMHAGSKSKVEISVVPIGEDTQDTAE